MDFKKIKKLAEAQQDYMVEMRRYFHTHAEVSDHEFGTRKVLQRELDSLNIPYELLEGTGIIATIQGGKPGKHRLLRCDIDAESGESANTFIGAGRLKKALTQMKKGDYLFMEFGHNDQKQKGPGKGAFYSFMYNLKIYIDEARSRGAYPVLVTPTQRRRFDKNGKIVNTHLDYPDAIRWLAAKENVPFRPARYDNIADPHFDVFVGQVTRELECTMVRHTHQILMDFIVHLFEIEHDQVGDFQQLIDHRIVAANKTVSIQTSMNTFFFTGPEPVTYEFSLQDSFAARRCHAASGGVHKVAVGHHLFH